MEFRNALRGRHIVRNYRTDPIPTDVLNRIVKVAHRAPSAGFSQGHHARLPGCAHGQARRRREPLDELVTWRA
jgi:nitroreductase